MNLNRSFVFAIVVASVLSYGIASSYDTGTVFAQTTTELMTVSTHLPSYGNGDVIIISGNIADYDQHSSIFDGSITVSIYSPAPSFVSAYQIDDISANGNFQTQFIAGGPLWNTNGDYLVKLHFDHSRNAEAVVVYTGADKVIDIQIIPDQPDPPVVEPKPITPDPTPVAPPPPPPPPPPPVDPTPITPPPPPPPEEPRTPECGPGTELVDGTCQLIQVPIEPVDTPPDDSPDTPGCLIATAAFGSELAPQVQFLREVRDNTVMTTSSGAMFMTGFNQLYYSFSPTIADMEYENPLVRDAIRAFITPMISTLSIMSLADAGSELQVVGLGISVIVLNLGMYIVAPALIGFKIRRHVAFKKHHSLD